MLTVVSGVTVKVVFEEMTDVFISYAKADNEDGKISTIEGKLSVTVSKVQDDTTISVWFDENNIRASEHWAKEIELALEKTHTFAAFISPRYFASLVCNQELEKAQELGKKIIPVWVQEVSAGGVEAEIKKRQSQGKATAPLSDALRNYGAIENSQAIRYDTDTSPDKEKSLERLITAIFENARLDDGATEWLERALAKERGTGGWLTGADLVQAEQWLEEAGRTPNFIVLDKTKNFIVASRRAENRRRITLGLVSVLTLIVIAVVGIIAWQQSVERDLNEQIALQNEKVSESIRLAGEANQILNNPTGNAEASALLGIRALQSTYTSEADAALRRALDYLHTTQLFEIEAKTETNQMAVSYGQYNQDGSQLFTSNSTGLIQVWDTDSGNEIQRLQFNPGLVAFSPNGEYMLKDEEDGPTKLYDLINEDEIYHFNLGRPSALAFSPDGRYAVVSAIGIFHMWDLEANVEIKPSMGFDMMSVSSIAISSSNSYLIIGGCAHVEFGSGNCLESSAVLWDLQNQQPSYYATGHADRVSSVAFSPDENYFLTGSYDKTARLWETTTGREVQNYIGHDGAVTSVSFSPDGQHILTGSVDNTARLWITNTGAEVHRFSGHTDRLTKVEFAPDRQSIMTFSVDGTMRLWSINPDLGPRQLLSSEPIQRVGWSANGEYILVI